MARKKQAAKHEEPAGPKAPDPEQVPGGVNRTTEEMPEGHELQLVGKITCGAPNDAGPKLNFEIPLEENRELIPWPVMREIANGRLGCRIQTVAEDGQTGSMLDRAFESVGDAGKVGWNGAKRTIGFGISFKNGDEGKHAALDLHNRRCQITLSREGDAGGDENQGNADPDDPNQPQVPFDGDSAGDSE